MIFYYCRYLSHIYNFFLFTYFSFIACVLLLLISLLTLVKICVPSCVRKDIGQIILIHVLDYPCFLFIVTRYEFARIESFSVAVWHSSFQYCILYVCCRCSRHAIMLSRSSRACSCSDMHKDPDEFILSVDIVAVVVVAT